MSTGVSRAGFEPDAREDPPLRIARRPGEKRTPAQLREHYEIERELASRLRHASREERRTLYTAVYDEMFRRVPHHPMLHSRHADNQGAHWNLKFLSRFLTRDTTYLEVGPGDCSFACRMASRVKEVIAIDVTEELIRESSLPANFRLVLSDGCSIPVREGSVDLAFSNQLMEHLHPDDAAEQLRNIRRSLKPGGRYVCVTPNRLYGPSDQSQYYDEVATCFHLKEYSVSEISTALSAAGFARTTLYVGARRLFLPAPAWPVRVLEDMLDVLPYRLRKTVADCKPMRAVLGIRIVAEKPIA